MGSSDRELLDPVIVALNLNENMSNEFQAPKSMTKSELKKRLKMLRLDYDNDLQKVVDEMGEM